MMWEELHEKPIEQPCRHEGINVSNRKQVLSASRDLRRITASDNDVVDKAREWRRAADEESSYSPPVSGEFG